MRFKLIVAYEGTAYRGWQLQPNGPSLQGVIEDAVLRFSGAAARVQAAGRTDAGVHAAGQVVAVDLVRPFAAEVVQRALNALTPEDISVLGCEPVSDDFDPRRSASSRVYAYRIWNAPVASPFWRRFAWHIPRRLDLTAMQGAAAQLCGEHDFTSFQAAGCAATHARRRVLISDLARCERLITYTVEANAFLRHMVRNIVGTLVEIGSGDRAAGDLPRLLAARDRTRAGATAPAHGLCLERVNYATGIDPEPSSAP